LTYFLILIHVQVKKIRFDNELSTRQNRAAIKIEKLYRGFKGREKAEVERAMKVAREQARPLFEKQKLLIEEVAKAQLHARKYSSGWDMLKVWSWPSGFHSYPLWGPDICGAIDVYGCYRRTLPSLT